MRRQALRPRGAGVERQRANGNSSGALHQDWRAGPAWKTRGELEPTSTSPHARPASGAPAPALYRCHERLSQTENKIIRMITLAAPTGRKPQFLLCRQTGRVATRAIRTKTGRTSITIISWSLLFGRRQRNSELRNAQRTILPQWAQRISRKRSPRGGPRYGPVRGKRHAGGGGQTLP
jgi:hypothetical protein